MRISISTLAFVLCTNFFSSLLFVGCTPVSVEEDCQDEPREDTAVVNLIEEEIKNNCHYEGTGKTTIIEFADSTARSLSFSPFDKHKVFIHFQKELVEFDLSTCNFQILNDSHWKRGRFRNRRIYQDDKNSSVWISGYQEKELIRYDKKSNEVRYYPLEYVSKIIPYKEKIYFASSKGLYIKDSISEEVIKIESIPLEKINTSYLTDRRTLILNSKIIYDFETDNWKEEMLPINKNTDNQVSYLKWTEKVRIYKEENGYCYSTDTDVGLAPY